MLESGEIIQCDMCFPFLSFPPSVEGFGLENTQIKIAAYGNIEVNDSNETNVPGVYSIGNVAGKCG